MTINGDRFLMDSVWEDLYQKYSRGQLSFEELLGEIANRRAEFEKARKKSLEEKDWPREA